MESLKILNQNFEISSQFLQSIFDKLGDSVKIIDKNFEIIFINEVAEKNIGKPLGFTIGGKCHEEFYGTENVCSFCSVSKVFETGKEELVEYSSISENGEKRFYELRIFPVKDDFANVNQVIEVSRDVTERKRLEERLIYSEKLALLGEISMGVAHEIRNPLTGIRLGLDVLSENVKKDPENSEIIESIVKDINRLDSVLNQMLDFTKEKTLEKKATNLLENLENALFFIKRLAKKQKVSIVKNYNPMLKILHFADVNQIQQVFLNILLNAIQSMENGGTLFLTVNQLKDGTEFIFTDTGYGISEENQKKLFNLFFTTKPNGTGIGLTMSNRIIKAHDGTIVIESEEKKGTTVRIFLPDKN